MRVSFEDVKINILYGDGSQLDCLSNLHEFTLERINQLAELGFVFENFHHVTMTKDEVIKHYVSIRNNPNILGCSDCLVVS